MRCGQSLAEREESQTGDHKKDGKDGHYRHEPTGRPPPPGCVWTGDGGARSTGGADTRINQRNRHPGGECAPARVS